MSGLLQDWAKGESCGFLVAFRVQLSLDKTQMVGYLLHWHEVAVGLAAYEVDA